MEADLVAEYGLGIAALIHVTRMSDRILAEAIILLHERNFLEGNGMDLKVVQTIVDDIKLKVEEMKLGSNTNYSKRITKLAIICLGNPDVNETPDEKGIINGKSVSIGNRSSPLINHIQRYSEVLQAKEMISIPKLLLNITGLTK